MQILPKRLTLLLTIALVTACGSARNARPINTPLPLPSFTPIVVARRQATAAPTASPTSSPFPNPTSTAIPAATETQSTATKAASRGQATPAVSGTLSRDAAPIAITGALRSAGIDSKVYWFTFDTGDREQALMVQYASPIVHRPGYAEMLLTVKAIAAAHFLKIGPPLYTLFIAATDLTGASDTVLRLRREAVDRWSGGEIDDAELLNNGFEHVRIVVTCTETACTAVEPTPLPTFPPFPFPFPTSTP